MCFQPPLLFKISTDCAINRDSVLLIWIVLSSWYHGRRSLISELSIKEAWAEILVSLFNFFGHPVYFDGELAAKTRSRYFCVPSMFTAFATPRTHRMSLSSLLYGHDNALLGVYIPRNFPGFQQ